MVKKMKIKKLVLGILNTNCYIVIKNDNCLIIDPASDADAIINACKPYHVKGILVTHHHFDHIGALSKLESYYKLKHNTFNDNFGYEVIKTPGHASDSLTFYFKKEKIMFTGDFLFYNTCGRCDLETSNVNDMLKSLNKIKEYPNDIIIYPGHGKYTILGEEKPLFDTYFH